MIGTNCLTTDNMLTSVPSVPRGLQNFFHKKTAQLFIYYCLFTQIHNNFSFDKMCSNCWDENIYFLMYHTVLNHTKIL